MAKRRGARVHRRTIRGGQQGDIAMHEISGSMDGRVAALGGGRKKMARTRRRTRRGGRPHRFGPVGY